MLTKMALGRGFISKRASLFGPALLCTFSGGQWWSVVALVVIFRSDPCRDSASAVPILPLLPIGPRSPALSGVWSPESNIRSRSSYHLLPSACLCHFRDQLLAKMPSLHARLSLSQVLACRLAASCSAPAPKPQLFRLAKRALAPKLLHVLSSQAPPCYLALAASTLV